MKQEMSTSHTQDKHTAGSGPLLTDISQGSALRLDLFLRIPRVMMRLIASEMSAGTAATSPQERRREAWPYTVMEWRYVAGGAKIECRSRLELLVYLLAHEIHHSNEGNPSRFVQENEYSGRYRIDRRTMEYACNQAGTDAVLEFRKAWPKTLRARVYREMRKARDGKNLAQKKTTAKRCDPSIKIAHFQELLDKWKKKERAAKNKITKYRQKVRYYGGRMAAKAEGRDS